MPGSTIAFIALNEDMLEDARRILAGPNADVRLALGLMGGAVETARALMAQGVEVAVSRGATARMVRDALPDLSVVDMSTSGLDLLTAIHRAGARARRIAVVAFPPMPDGALEIGRILGLDVSVFEWDREEEIGPTIARARAAGAEILVGGYIMAKVAAAMGMPCQPVEGGARSILAAVAEARRIAHGRSVEKAKASLLRAVLTSTDNGIVAVDGRGIVNVFNPVAQHILRMTEADAVGKDVAEVWPRSGLPEALASGKAEAGRIERAFDREIMCNRAVFSVGGEPVGAVATFHDVRQIQKMEATVRSRILASGHVAASRFQDVLGESPALRQAIAMGRDFARARSTVLIQGETGTGKELFAQGIHNESERRKGPFVAVNCAALPGQLLESELFGYVPGAFTGASQKGKPGLFELAHGGTIFLDEVAEMEPSTQGKLLRVLQEKKVMRLGSDQVIPVDVRVVAATNKDLARLVREGAFRDDLYFRINVLRLVLPPLRERREDVARLAAWFLRQAQPRGGALGLSREAQRELTRHGWPGNVRELQNIMERVAVLCREHPVPGSLVRGLLEQGPGRQEPARPGERERIQQALASCNGRMGRAAKSLGMSRSTLWRRLRALGQT